MPFAESTEGSIFYQMDGRGEPLIMLLPQSRGPRGVNALIDLLSKKFNVIRYDQIGTGRSHLGSGNYDLSIPNRANEVATVLDSLAIESANLLCHSTGCGIGLATAYMLNKRVKSLILINPWSYADDYISTMQRLRISAANNLSPYDYAHFNFTMLFPAQYRRLYQKEFEQIAVKAISQPHNPDQIKNRLEAILEYDTREIASKVSCSTLAITSNDDILMPNWHAAEIVENIPNSCLTTLRYGGHMLPETRGKRILSEICDFLIN